MTSPSTEACTETKEKRIAEYYDGAVSMDAAAIADTWQLTTRASLRILKCGLRLIECIPVADCGCREAEQTPSSCDVAVGIKDPVCNDVAAWSAVGTVRVG